MSVSKEVTITFLSCCEVGNKIYNRSLTGGRGVDCKSLLFVLGGVCVMILCVYVICSHSMKGRGSLYFVTGSK